MKKLLCSFALISLFAQADVSSSGQKIFSDMLSNVGLKTYWSQANSLWVENPGGMSELDLEKIGNSLCGYGQGFFVVTFWQNIRSPSGKITSVTCRN
jgi:hypothetical protein